MKEAISFPTFPTYKDFIEDFDFQDSVLLGSGTFGKVYKAKAKRPISTTGK